MTRFLTPVILLCSGIRKREFLNMWASLDFSSLDHDVDSIVRVLTCCHYGQTAHRAESDPVKPS